MKTYELILGVVSFIVGVLGIVEAVRAHRSLKGFSLEDDDLEGIHNDSVRTSSEVEHIVLSDPLPPFNPALDSLTRRLNADLSTWNVTPVEHYETGEGMLKAAHAGAPLTRIVREDDSTDRGLEMVRRRFLSGQVWSAEYRAGYHALTNVNDSVKSVTR